MKLKAVLIGLLTAVVAAPIVAANFFSPDLTASTPGSVFEPVETTAPAPEPVEPATTISTTFATSTTITSAPATAVVSEPALDEDSRPILWDDPEWSRNIVSPRLYQSSWIDSQNRRFWTTQVVWSIDEQGQPPRVLMREKLSDGSHRWFYQRAEWRTEVSFAILPESGRWEVFHTQEQAPGTASADTAGLGSPYAFVVLIRQNLTYPDNVNKVPVVAEQTLERTSKLCDWIGLEDFRAPVPPLPNWAAEVCPGLS